MKSRSLNNQTLCCLEGTEILHYWEGLEGNQSLKIKTVITVGTSWDTFIKIVQKEGSRMIVKQCTRPRLQKRNEKKHFNLDPDSSDEGCVFAASVGSAGLPDMGKWLVDSGASSHMTSKREILTNYHDMSLKSLRRLAWVMVRQSMPLMLEMSM